MAYLGVKDDLQSPIASDAALALPIDPIVGLPILRGPLDAGRIRATIAAHGSVIVPNALAHPAAEQLREIAVTALSAQDAVRSGVVGSSADDWYSALASLKAPWQRELAAEAGGMLAADSPRGVFRGLDILEDAGITRLATEYLGVRPAFSAEKTVFRRLSHLQAPPPGYGWHQDGAFMGAEIRTLDVWIALTECGRFAPSLEILPRRVERILPNRSAYLTTETISQEYPGVSPVIPELRPGDAILFDQLCVHRTGHAPGMTETRLAVECWMFAPGSVPHDYTGFIL